MLTRLVSAPGVSDVGDIAFDASIREGGSSLRDGLYIARTAGSVDTIAITGDPVPGSSPAATFKNLDPPAMSPGGKVTFAARIVRGVSPRVRRAVFIEE